MKRSDINRYIAEAIDFFAKQSFPLPSFASWTPEDWQVHGNEADAIREGMLGWDVTDFNTGNFGFVGLTLFALRNGESHGKVSSKTYAEKIMLVREKQVTPFHFHYRKTEDIINRGNASTGNLVVQLYNSTPEHSFSNTQVHVFCDGIERQIEAGGTVLLQPGDSITLTPGLYHSFYAVNGPALIGEVSSVNEDVHDNHFYQQLPRFPEIIEDEPPFRLLCTDYSK